MAQRAWSFKAIDKDDLRYWGNDGYHDDSSAYYRYDNFVANHKNVKKGDIVIITNREHVLGISLIDTLTTRNIQKKRYKCIHEHCNSKKILPRKTKQPEWRCDKGHEFEVPRVIFEEATEFLANYKASFTDLNSVSLEELIIYTPRFNGQMSIQEVNFVWASNLLVSKNNNGLMLNANDAEDNTPLLLEGDQRKSIIRQIKQRRGQKKFRDELIILNPSCAVTECSLLDILEAAHIEAYRNDSHNHASNGLLLRSDIHTLFDLNLCAINPQTKTIHFSQQALLNNYASYEGKKIKVKHALSIDALNKRWSTFNKNI